MKKKIDILIDLIKAGKDAEALSLAAKFPNLGEHRDAIIEGDSARKNPAFYRQIKKDPSKLYEDGVKALHQRYSRHLESL